MARKKERKAYKPKLNYKKQEPSYLIISVAITIILLAGFIVKIAFSPTNIPVNSTEILETSSRIEGSIDEQVKRIASNFSCACGGCGELPLVECTCDMPRGAQEEKAFIRNKLMEGFATDNIIRLVEKKYGYRIT